MSSIKNIKNSSEKSKKNNREYYIFNSIPIYIKDFFQENIDLLSVIKKIENNIPKKLFKDLDVIYIGEFPELNSRNVESVFLNSAIYLSNTFMEEDELFKSIVHELAHNIEEIYQDFVYGDEQIISEFISKRKQLRQILESNKLFCNPVLYLKLDHDEDFDNFLYKTVGYDKLAIFSSNIFASPYAATDLREYFSNGFENYYCSDSQQFLKIIVLNFIKKYLP